MIRKLLDDLERGPPPDPLEAARRGMRRSLPKRFYEKATAEVRDAAFVVVLDGRVAKTPARHALALPTHALAETAAAEWEAQGERIDPATMPLTRLANVAIDRVAREPDAIAAEIVKYSASDLVCYRAGEPAELAAVQAAAWDPVLEWARSALGAEFALGEGVRFVAQPEAAVAAVRAEVGRFAVPFPLAALATAASLAGSALIALALARGRLTVEEAWAAACVDEDWNIGRWGDDAEAARWRSARLAEFKAAALVLAQA